MALYIYEIYNKKKFTGMLFEQHYNVGHSKNKIKALMNAWL